METATFSPDNSAAWPLLPRRAERLWGVPLAAYIAEVMGVMEAGRHPGGEVPVACDRFRRTAERAGCSSEVFAAIDPA